MRYYFIDENEEEFLIDFKNISILSNGVLDIDCSMNVQNVWSPQKVYLRSLGPTFFISKDQIKWRRLMRPTRLHDILFVNRHLKTFRGFRPSGMQSGEQGDLRSQMPGKVVKVLVKKGQVILKGQTLAILEAMKMENEVKASFAGLVKEIHIKEGQTIESGHVLMELEPKED